MKFFPWVLAVVLLAPFSGRAQAIDVPYRGLNYSMISRDGLTVMIAPLDLSILDYSAAHVWITNGSRRTIHLEPQLFSARMRTSKQPDGAEYIGLSDLIVVQQVMNRAKFGDIMALVRTYERNLYGFRNPDAINYYEVRKQVAAASGGSRKVRAAAMVSAIILPKADIAPGEFREGTIFFQTKEKHPQFVELTAHLAGLALVFRPSPPEK